MPVKTGVALLACAVISLSAGFRDAGEKQPEGPQYTSDGRLKLPLNYREWVYVTSGFDMSYNPNAAAGEHVFDTVFANPEAYQGFKETGSWPDKTILVLENRGATSRGSINQSGHYQSERLTGIEAHVKDSSRFSTKWAFFAFGDSKDAKVISQSADCYSCHADHGAVDTTFVQFYPTLLSIAKSKATLSMQYLKEAAAVKK